MLEFNLVVKEGHKQKPGFQAEDSEMETMVVALNPNVIVSVAKNRKDKERTDICYGTMIVTADEEYDSVLQRILDFNAIHIYAHIERDCSSHTERDPI